MTRFFPNPFDGGLRMSKTLLIAVLAAAPLLVHAADETKKAATPQREKMAACSRDAHAKGLKGDERKKFMSECLSAGKSAKNPPRAKSPA
ncbi:MAG TPA: PsiF family protein [Burkholderiaceae bacterium]